MFKQLIKNGEVYTLKLVSGEEVLGKVIESNDKCVLLHKPLILTVQANAQGQASMVFAPLGLTYDPKLTNELEFKHEHILYCFPTPSEFEKQYTSSTSGIQIVY